MTISAADKSAAGQWRFIAAGVLVLGVLAGLAGGIYWGLGTCQPLDRWLGVSGCQTRIIVSDFNPLSLQSMVWPRGQQTISLFGNRATADNPPRPGMVRIALPGGEERGRTLLPAKHIIFLRASADGARAMLQCHSPCNENGDAVLLVSVADGQTTAALADSTAIFRAFPGEAEPLKSPVEDAVALPGGKYAAKLSTDGKEIVLHAADDGRVVRSMPSGMPGAPLSPFFLIQPSPSGRLIATLDNDAAWSRRGTGSIIRIWDVESGQQRASIQTDHDYQRDLLWSWDEKTIVLARRIKSKGGAATAIDLFDWRSKAVPAVAGKAASS